MKTTRIVYANNKVVTAALFAAASDTDTVVQLTLPATVYAVVGAAISLYFEDVVRAQDVSAYTFEVVGDLGTTSSTRWTATPTAGQVGDHPLVVSVKDAQGRVVDSGSTVVRVAASNAGVGKTVRMLIVGDSLTAAGVYPTSLGALLTASGTPSWAMLGSVSPSAGIAHEGRSGWRWTNFLNDVTSPFLDVASYVTTQCGGQAPDLVTFLLGINDCFSANPDAPDATIDTMLGNAETLLARFRVAMPSASFAICLTTPPNILQAAFEANYGSTYTRWGWKRIQHRLVQRLITNFGGREAEKIYLVPTELSLDPVAGFPSNNAVHPNSTGYDQLAGSFFAWIKAKWVTL